MVDQDQIVLVDVADIMADPENPRPIDDAHVARLAGSFEKTGGENSLVTNPIIIKEMDESGDFAYIVNSGNHRLLAYKQNGYEKIPAIGVDLTGADFYERAIMDNHNRKNASPMENARAFKISIEKGSSISKLAEIFGRPESYIETELALNNLPADMQNEVESKDCPLAVARKIATSCADAKDMTTAWKRARRFKKLSQQLRAVDKHLTNTKQAEDTESTPASTDLSKKQCIKKFDTFVKAVDTFKKILDEQANLMPAVMPKNEVGMKKLLKDLTSLATELENGRADYLEKGNKREVA